MSEEQFKNRSIITEGILLAVITGLIYWISMSYEVAYLGEFGIPSEFAEVRLETILLMFFAFSGVGWLFFSTANFLAMAWPKHPALQEKLLRIGVALLIPIWTFFSFGFRQKDIVLYLFVIFLLVFIEFLWPIVVYKKEGSLLDRFVADEAREGPARSRTLISRLAAISGPFAYILIILGLFGSSLARITAQAKAQKQSEYSVLVNEPTLAVIRLYSDKILGVKFDEETKRLNGKFVLIPIDSKSDFQFVWKKIGPFIPFFTPTHVSTEPKKIPQILVQSSPESRGK